MFIYIIQIISICIWIYILTYSDSDIYIAYIIIEIIWALLSSVIFSLYQESYATEFLIDSPSFLYHLKRELIGAGIIIGTSTLWNYKLENYYRAFKEIKEQGTVSISFERFKNLYNIAPNKWTIDESTLKYQYIFHPNCYYGYEYKNLKFISLLDYIKFWHFLTTINKNKKHQTNEEELAFLTKEWLADIEKYKTDNDITSF